MRNITCDNSEERTKVPQEVPSEVNKHPFPGCLMEATFKFLKTGSFALLGSVDQIGSQAGSQVFALRLPKQSLLPALPAQSLSHTVSLSYSASSVPWQPCTYSPPSSHDFSLNTKRQAKSQARRKQQPIP